MDGWMDGYIYRYIYTDIYTDIYIYRYIQMLNHALKKISKRKRDQVEEYESDLYEAYARAYIVPAEVLHDSRTNTNGYRWCFVRTTLNFSFSVREPQIFRFNE